ncbi:Probable polygalacturonase At3g15720 [Linum grandiflorum]
MTSSSSDDRHETLGYGRAGVFNVLDYGAVGDGRSDSSAAFAKAWDDFCGARGNPTLVIPAGKVFLLNPVSFQGPCNSQKLRIQALKFHSCNNLVLNSLHHVNSQRNHISISGSNGVDISHIMITAPETSPNTDGIDIATSSNLNIHDSFIGTGDDCIAINGFTSHVNISRLMCGPGHGISIGSLGKNGCYETVEDVHVRDCTFKGTTNGARIKTWKGGRGYVRRVSFQDITLVNAENPIIIDQEYFSENARPSRDYVAISDIRYSGVRGTCSSEEAVDFNCVGGSGCKGIVVENLDIRAAIDNKKKRVIAVCNNVHGWSRGDMSPKMSYCLRP